MSTIPAPLRRLVVERANEKCEYCLISQNFSIYTHEVDHIIATKHGGQTTAENLALSCLSCNRHKGTDLATFDSLTNELTLLFNPRLQNWTEHFSLQSNAHIVGKTSTGRATAFLLMFNRSTTVLNRQTLITQNLYP